MGYMNTKQETGFLSLFISQLTKKIGDCIQIKEGSIDNGKLPQEKDILLNKKIIWNSLEPAGWGSIMWCWTDGLNTNLI